MPYNFITLNARSIVAYGNFTIEKPEYNDNKNAVIFKYDLSFNGSDIREIVLNEMEQQDNALYYQLAQCDLIKKHEKENALKEPKDILREHLVYVDFESIFKDKNLNMPLGDAYKEQSEETLKSKDGIAFRLRWMFDPDNGIQLSFRKDNKTGENIWQTFVPFDKSSSMSRNYQITFIDKDLKAEVENKLLLDMRFYKKDKSEDNPIPVVSSKYYTYRGLYLSTGYRINHEHNGDVANSLYLNQETVIVIPDENGIIPKESLFTATTTDKNNYNENTKWEFIKCEKNIKPNLFDGEGIICREYAAIINNQLTNIYHFDNDSHSFQIRMPFAKGMLHEVDLQLFLDEQLAANTFIKEKPAELFIRDVFKIKRDLRKAKIILTESMFKCTDWLQSWREFAKKGKTALFASEDDLNLVKSDPMKYYFTKMYKYHHALYITNTDARFTDAASVPLNYQFFSTLAISPEVFEDLIKGHIDYIKAVPERIANKPRYKVTVVNDEENFEEEIVNLIKKRKDISLSIKCMQALAANKAFLSDPKVKSIIKSEQRKQESYLCLGRINVKGEQRYLSGDLLDLLCVIYGRVINIDFDRAQMEGLKKQRLFFKNFYMPQKKMQLRHYRDYGFFRNPHLARNEQCLLRPYTVDGSLYEHYFSHLTGIVMISSKTIVAMALSGADFDGDMVKIVCDNRIVNAIKKGAYKNTQINNTCEENSGDNTKKKVFVEKVLPVIEIPKLNGDSETDFGTIPFKTIKNTFSNQIGQISNTAVKFSRKEYEYKENSDGTLKESSLTPNEEKEGKCCAACTIITGLEIDAAKTGVHPKANIEVLQANASFFDPFLNSKQALKKIYKEKRFFTPHVKKEDDNTLTLYLTSYDRIGVQGLTKIKVYTADKIKKENQNKALAAQQEETRADVIQGTDFVANTEKQAETSNITAQEPVANIDWLPGRYLSYLKEEADKKAVVKTSKKVTGDSIYYKFQINKDWKKKLDRSKKEKVWHLAEAYLKICDLGRKIDATRESIKKHKNIGRIKTLLNIQYDDIYKEQISGASITDILNQAYLEIYTVICKHAKIAYYLRQQPTGPTTAETVAREVTIDDICISESQNILKRFIKEKWQYTTTEDRKASISYILGLNEETENEISPSVFDLLTNFRNEGYMIFYYILKDIQNNFNRNLDSEAYLRSQTNDDDYNSNTDITDEDEAGVDEDNAHEANGAAKYTALQKAEEASRQVEVEKYYNELYAVYAKLSTRRKVEWNRDLVLLCRKELKDIFNDDMDEALKHVYSIPTSKKRKKDPVTQKYIPVKESFNDSQRNFLWNIFTAEEILKNIYEPPKTLKVD